MIIVWNWTLSMEVWYINWKIYLPKKRKTFYDTATIIDSIILSLYWYWLFMDKIYLNWPISVSCKILRKHKLGIWCYSTKMIQYILKNPTVRKIFTTYDFCILLIFHNIFRLNLNETDVLNIYENRVEVLSYFLKIFDKIIINLSNRKNFRQSKVMRI